MTLSKRADYVTRSAICLARAHEVGSSRKIREVVADTAIPATFASQILADLVRAGLAVARAGRAGGYRLSRPPEQISVLEVIEAADGPLHADRCALGDDPCRWEAVCPLHETWSQVTATLRELLARTTLAQLAARDAAIEAGTYPIPPDSHLLRPLAVRVSDSVQIELPEATLHTVLAREGPTLGRIVEVALYEGGSPGTGGTGRRTVRGADASLVKVASSVAKGPEEVSRYLLAWRVDSPTSSSRLEADLSVNPVDAERCEVCVDGTWRQDTRDATASEATELERVANRTLRSFLRRLAQSLEQQASTNVSRDRALGRSSNERVSRST